MGSQITVPVTTGEQKITASVSGNNVVLSVPTMADATCDYQTTRHQLMRLRTRIEANSKSTCLTLFANGGNELVYEVQSLQAASRLVREVDAIKQLLGKRRWGLTPIKAFTVGAVVGLLSVVFIAAQMGPTNVAQANVSEPGLSAGQARGGSYGGANQSKAETWTP